MNKDRFYELLDTMKILHDAKRHDYGNEDELANFKLSELAGIPAWKGCVVRMGDKFSRIMGFAKKVNWKLKMRALRIH